jgi:hypothetical protein
MKTKIILVICLLFVQFISAGDLKTESKQAFLTINHPGNGAFPFFRAFRIGADVSLNWVYQNPILVVFFVVERSTDGVNFSPVDEVMSSDAYFYRFRDRTIPSGTSMVYYRIVACQHDGTVVYTNIDMVRMGGRRCN